MPELPEVEIVTRNLNQILKPPFKITEWIFFRKDLRFKIPQKQLLKLKNIAIHKISRRAKYILFHCEEQVFLSHLGMTGSWRVENKNWVVRKHDHLAFQFHPQKYLVYEDPRRFGFVEIFSQSEILTRFQGVGVEPLETSSDFKLLTQQFRQFKAPIKNALMNQKWVVGIGNIYASEILFQARVSPLRSCSEVSEKEYEKIWKFTKEILSHAIKKGGSTIENYKNSYGESGKFQNQFYVYGREGQKCKVCRGPIITKVLAGRNTFWCEACQK